MTSSQTFTVAVCLWLCTVLLGMLVTVVLVEVRHAHSRGIHDCSGEGAR